MRTEDVVRLATSRPWAQQGWAQDLLVGLPDRLDAAVQRWSLTLEGAHLDGAGLPVLDVLVAGAPAVLKLDGAGTDLAQQVRVLRAADGRGYVRLLDHAPDLGAALLERLGRPLSDTVPDPVAQTETLCDLLELAWELPADVGQATAPEDKALGLLEILTEELAHDGDSGAPRHTEILCRAADLARELARSPAPVQVVVHGDPHSLNALRRNGSYAFIDPDGFRCEREYDAGVVLRDLMRQIDELDRRERPGAGRRWHASLVDRVADRLGLDRERVAAWAFVERVTTGVWLRRLGYAEEGEGWLATAGRMVG